ncbi:hypothetical protein WJX75_009508 [Coccomyxa subellipsoidea]|uniref:Prefoldin n=1 Tax=Coccomyxa subellipsoidea TaxID=248742 RepID=A0ABR2YJZ3_9CHLO
MDHEDVRIPSVVLEQKVRLLEIAAAELRSLKPDRAVYTKKGAIFFRTDRSAAETSVQEQIKELRAKAMQSSTS